MFQKTSKVIIYGRHLDVAQRMLDFDYISGRTPSVAGIVDPGTRRIVYTKVFFGNGEILLPIYPDFASIPADIHIDTCVNMASFRSAADATWQAIHSEMFAHIVIIAEGIPERDIREIIAFSNEKNIRIIGPATAGAICAGTLRMGNSGGSLENIVACGLHKKGSVGFVSRSGGMSNEMYRVIGTRTDGIHTGIALGGDRYVCSTFRDVVTMYQADPEIHMIVLLGEVGGRDELDIADMLSAGTISKPIVAYIAGSFAERLSTPVQFGHAGAKANADEEKATYKNDILRKAGAYVPTSYAGLGDMIQQVYEELRIKNEEGIIDTEVDTDRIVPLIKGAEDVKDIPHPDPLHVGGEGDMDIIHTRLSHIHTRKSTHITSTISDERGEDVTYNHIPLTTYIADASIAKVIGALWLKRELPVYALEYINTILILLADHGPAVSGATNTIVAARAGKDILSSLVSGLLTIGPRFGGAIDTAAHTWYTSVRTAETPDALVQRMKKAGTPISGIGHRVKSKWNPDGRCNILKTLAKNIPTSTYLDYALQVEALTLEKKANLILNVDGHIAASLLDIFSSIGMSPADIEMYIESGICNAFFILARSIGLIGHALDQKRLGEGLYRTAWEDIHYGE